MVRGSYEYGIRKVNSNPVHCVMSCSICCDLIPHALNKQQIHIVISSSEMLKPHWLKSSHVTGTINAYCFFYAPKYKNVSYCNMNV